MPASVEAACFARLSQHPPQTGASNRLAVRAGLIYFGAIVYLLGFIAMHVAKWGNSLAVRLPQSVVEALKLKEGDQIEIQVMGARALEVERASAPKELLTRLRKLRGRLPANFKFDRLEANERR